MGERLAYLDGLRGIAALNVVFGHALVAFDFALYTGDPSAAHGRWEVPLSGWPLLFPAAGQNFSVCVFLVLSGYVLAHVYRGGRLGAAALAVKRYARLGIPILAATLFSWALLAGGLMYAHSAQPLTGSGWLGVQLVREPSLRGAVAEGVFGALIGPWQYLQSYDSSLWTMSVEFAGSLMLIGVFRGVPRGVLRGRLGQSDGVAAGLLLGLSVLLFPTYLSLLAAGACLQMIDLPRRARVPGLVVLALVGVALVLGTVPFSPARGAGWDWMVAMVPGRLLPIQWAGIGPGFQVLDGPAALHGLGAVLLLIAVECHAGVRRVLAARVPAALGLISFPLYLVHVPVLLSVGCGTLLFVHRLGSPYGVAAAAAAAVTLVVSLLLAALAVPLLERPAVRVAGMAGAAVQRGVDRMRLTRPRAAPAVLD